jgi:hypothetical protein
VLTFMVKESVILDGKRYHFAAYAVYKHDAKLIAKRFRRGGIKARVLPITKPTTGLGSGALWVVYTR